jgi:hypothetical protein
MLQESIKEINLKGSQKLTSKKLIRTESSWLIGIQKGKTIFCQRKDLEKYLSMSLRITMQKSPLVIDLWKRLE